MTPELDTIPVDQIEVGARLRSLKDHRIEVLSKDIDLSGQLQPILVVRRATSGFVLVDGAHRLAAIKLLKHAEIEAKVLPADTPHAELAYGEIMANVNREDLTKLERAEHLVALKAAWADMNPAARHGGDRRSAAVRAVKEAQAEAADQSAVFALCSDVAEKVGLGRRSFYNAIEIATKLSDATKARVRGTWIEDHQATLQALSKEEAEIQAKACDALLNEPLRATTIADALMLAHGHPLKPPSDKLWERAVSTWGRMPKTHREAFIEQHKREFMEIAKKKGWME